jgi:magnesium transporter
VPSNRKRIGDLFEEEGLSKEELRERFLVMHPVDLADYIEDLRVKEKAHVIEILDTDQALKVFQLLPTPSKMSISRWIGRDRLAQLLERLPPDEATDLAMHLGRKRQKEALELLKPETRQPIDKLIVYPKHTAGGVMTTRVPKARETQTAEEILAALRESTAENLEEVYVLDEEGKLRGQARIRDLLRARGDDPVRNLARPVEHRARPETDQEEVAKIVERYKLNSMPVVDAEGRLIGVVNLHDILHVVRQESAEDMLKMAGAEAQHALYDSLLARLRGRSPAILIALGIEMVVALVISQAFGQTIRQFVLLAAFIPVIIALAGGVALQSSTTVVRGLIDGSLARSHWLGVILAELKTGFVISFFCGIIAGVAGFLLHAGNGSLTPVALIAGSIMFGMVCSLTFAAALGAGMPMIMHRIGLDPAASSGPLITSFNDLLGTTAYLLIASLILEA